MIRIVLISPFSPKHQNRAEEKKHRTVTKAMFVPEMNLHANQCTAHANEKLFGAGPASQLRTLLKSEAKIAYTN